MAIWILDQYTGELDYPTLGFRASTGDLLSATAAPDGRWSLHSNQAAAETVDRYTVGADPSYVEPADGHVLTWSSSSNTYVPTAQSAFTSSLNTQITSQVATASLPAADLRPFHASLANRRAEQVSIVMLGDSTIEGYRLASFAETLPQQLARALRDRFPVSGVTGGRGYVGLTTDPINLPFWPQTIGGGTLENSGRGPGMKSYRVDATGEKITYPVQAGGCTSFEIFHIKNSSGAVGGGYYKIDGGAAVNFDTNNATTIAAKLTVNSPANTSIEIGWNSGILQIAGIREYAGDETKGVQVHNAGFSGSYASQWTAQAGVVGTWPYFVPLLSPDLVIIQLGINDSLTAVGNRTPSQYATDITGMISALRLRGTSCPVVLSTTFDPGGTKVAAWSEYVAAAKGVADADATVVHVDHSARMPAATSDQGGLYLSSYLPHESAKGAALMAETFLATLAPR